MILNCLKRFILFFLIFVVLMFSGMGMVAYMQCYSWLPEDYNGQIIILITSVICVMLSIFIYRLTFSMLRTNFYILLCIVFLMAIMHFRTNDSSLSHDNIFLLIFVVISNFIGIYISKLVCSIWNNIKKILLKRWFVCYNQV